MDPFVAAIAESDYVVYIGSAAVGIIYYMMSLWFKIPAADTTYIIIPDFAIFLNLLML